MFEPKFTITNKIVNNLVEITSARDIILNAYLVPKWEITLRREAILKATHASTAIEGNPLNLEEVTKLAEGRKVMATRKAKQEVLNYLDVLENIDNYHEGEQITENNILDLQKDLTKKTLDNSKYEGSYRDVPVYVGNRITGEVFFTPPPPDEVQALMKELIEWLNSEECNKLQPVLVAGIAHYEFVRIHPFADGNGRTARALATLILFLSEFDIKGFFTLDDYYDSDRPAYYNALNSVDEKTIDITGWLEYFTNGVFISITRVKERVMMLSLDKKKKDSKGQIALSERQMTIIEHIIKNGRITSGDVQSMFDISRQAAHKEIKKLIDLEVIESKGVGKATYYVAK